MAQQFTRTSCGRSTATSNGLRPLAMEEALAWFRSQAMKSGRSRDDSFIAAQAARPSPARSLRAIRRAVTPPGKEYRQAAQMLDGASPMARPLARAAPAWNQDKAVRDGAKREKQEFAEQEQFDREIVCRSISNCSENRANRAEIRNAVEKQARRPPQPCRTREARRKVRVIKRALRLAGPGHGNGKRASRPERCESRERLF